MRTKILIVDDRAENLLTLESVLQTTGADIISADNGQDALKAVLDHDFAVLILDVRMPGMSGYELAALIRGRRKTQHTPIIFLSAVYSDESRVFQGYEYGAVDVLAKPFNHDILLDKVRVFLELDSQKKQLQTVVAELQQRNRQLTQLNQRLQHEIAERRQAERRLQQYAHELQAANEELSQYASVVSHDLKAPLRAIRNYAGFLREDLDHHVNAEDAQYFTQLNNAVGEAIAFVDDMLMLSRVGRDGETAEPVALAAIIHPLIESIRAAEPAIEVALADAWPTIESEPALLRQIFQNLIGNAVKFTTTLPKRVDIGWQSGEDGMYAIFVRDNGIGIDPQYHEKIFRIFDRLHTRTEFEGTGIGLAVVKKAVTKLGGTVRVDSRPGAGSTFWVRIPGRPPSAALPPEAPQKPMPEGYVVGIGASAGGYAALGTLFDAMPPDSGMAFVVALHQSPDRESLMDELLRKHTSMTVVMSTAPTVLSPNQIYLSPPGTVPVMADGVLQLSDAHAAHGHGLPIDRLFQSLATERGAQAAAIILSGTGADGAAGVQAVKQAGGLVLVQDPQSATFAGMPNSAIATGMADAIAEPEHIPASLLRLVASRANTHL